MHWAVSKGWKDFEGPVRGGLDCLEQGIGQNLNHEEPATEGLKASEEHVIRSWRKGFCWEVAESLATLSPALLWKVENVTSKLGDPAKEISSQSVEGAA